jgi:hypothetical protein
VRSLPSQPILPTVTMLFLSLVAGAALPAQVPVDTAAVMLRERPAYTDSVPLLGSFLATALPGARVAIIHQDRQELLIVQSSGKITSRVSLKAAEAPGLVAVSAARDTIAILTTNGYAASLRLFDFAGRAMGQVNLPEQSPGSNHIAVRAVADGWVLSNRRFRRDGAALVHPEHELVMVAIKGGIAESTSLGRWEEQTPLVKGRVVPWVHSLNLVVSAANGGGVLVSDALDYRFVRVGSDGKRTDDLVLASRPVAIPVNARERLLASMDTVYRSDHAFRDAAKQHLASLPLPPRRRTIAGAWLDADGHLIVQRADVQGDLTPDGGTRVDVLRRGQLARVVILPPRHRILSVANGLILTAVADTTTAGTTSTQRDPLRRQAYRLAFFALPWASP